MKSEGIAGSNGDIRLFRTIDGDWRVIDFSCINAEHPVTLYWNSCLKTAMQIFGRATARKQPKPKEAERRTSWDVRHQHIDTSFNVTIGPFSVKVDPHVTRYVKYQDRIVGYIKDINPSADGMKMMADVVITDPELLKQLKP